uniref:S-adenosylmethionine decarboxylase proenzyme n=1 Tax=Kalanchoe fedtschenkoi TaxID=63787 RepID=A0A7N1A0M4_KALFE
MAASGFEGFEKRLELHFAGDDPSVGLRSLDFDTLQQILTAVQCTIVSAVGNHFFDAYVLSESSLFVYPTKIIIKTCGTTQLLKSVRPFIHHAAELGLSIRTCRYTRGSFIFPKAQPFPYTKFEDEVFCLEQSLPDSLRVRKSSIMPSRVPSHSWHVFAASTTQRVGNLRYDDDDDDDDEALYTVEVCMTDLDSVLAKKFFQKPGAPSSGDLSGKRMTEITGINNIFPSALVCDFGFDPCGYSMNSVDGDRYSTIHVTPEDGFSYASFECVGSIYDDQSEIIRALNRAVQVFRPATVSVSTTSLNNQAWKSVAAALEPLGLKCRSCAADEFPAAGTVVYQTFTSRRKSNC